MRRLIALSWFAIAASAPSVADAFTNLHNRGGPVMAHPEIAPVYIGNWDGDSVNATQGYLQNFVNYLNGAAAPKGREQVVRQYGVLGASLLPPRQAFLVTGSGVMFGRDDVRRVISDAQNYFGAYPYAPGRIVLAITKGIDVQFDDGTIAFHDNDGTDRIYGFVPTEQNGDFNGLQLSISHELFEAATDPYPSNGLFQDQAWVYDTQSLCLPLVGCLELNTSEGGDECEGQSVPLAGGGVIQMFADNTLSRCDGWAAAPQLIAGDFNRDGLSDVALVGGPNPLPLLGLSLPQWDLVPIAFSKGDGSYNLSNKTTSTIGAYAKQDNVTVLSGDFDGDGASDIAMVGGIGWNSLPVAFSNKDGTFRITNAAIDQFASWAAIPNVQAVAADFNDDGKTDIALSGGPGWNTVPVAFSRGDGTFTVVNYSAPTWAQLATIPNMTILADSFAGTGRASLAMLGAAGWSSVAFLDFNGNGWNPIRSVSNWQFAEWASTPGVKPLVADVNRDGWADILLVGGPGWASVPVAYSIWTAGGQSFVVDNMWAPDFAWWATLPGARPAAAGRFGYQRGGVVLAGGWDWNSVPMALATFGTATVTNDTAGNFPLYAR